MTIEQSVTHAIDASMRNTFRKMLASDANTIQTCSANQTMVCVEDDDDVISVTIQWSGKLAGSITLAINDNSARAWTNGLLGESEDLTEQDLIDAVQELANLVIGGAKSSLEDFDLTMSLPVVRRTDGRSLTAFATADCIDMRFKHGPIHVAVFTTLNECLLAID
ncbi:chemotaxis protein CheX [Rhodopirellula sp. SWK7]|nr:chemotaxis protein CheX [Rhodopirellula sp. SWK7]